MESFKLQKYLKRAQIQGKRKCRKNGHEFHM